jgi:hypothetical protein
MFQHGGPQTAVMDTKGEFFDERPRPRLGKDTPPVTEGKSQPDIRLRVSPLGLAGFELPRARAGNSQGAARVGPLRRRWDLTICAVSNAPHAPEIMAPSSEGRCPFQIKPTSLSRR